MANSPKPNVDGGFVKKVVVAIVIFGGAALCGLIGLMFLPEGNPPPRPPELTRADAAVQAANDDKKKADAERVNKIKELEATFSQEQKDLRKRIAEVMALIDTEEWERAKPRLDGIEYVLGLIKDSSVASSPQAKALIAAADSAAAKLERRRKVEADPIEVVSSTWRKDGFGNIAVWTIKIKNQSIRPVGDFTYRTEYRSETGNVVDNGGVDAPLGGSRMIQKRIEPGATRTIEVNDGFLHSEAVRASFHLVSWKFLR